MEKDDFRELGFKCGVEIHQRLDTRKLFCDCSSDMEEEPSGSVVRKLRAVPGELGEMDPASLYEFLRDRSFVYKYYPSESCDVELDEEPPHEIRQEALEIALQVSKMLGCEVPRELHTMRKTVIDGSNTAGFQRTVLVGIDGKLEAGEGEVGVQNLCLEEESAQILERRGDTVVYGLNRLGIPLVEIGTAPDIKSPSHAQEVAERIGRLLRSTGKVQRGIGTIRQDINVSIEEGSRVEIKGLQELDMIEKTVRLEVERQRSLLDIRDELQKRKASVPGEIITVTDIFEESGSDFANKLASKGEVKASKLEKFGGLLARKMSGGKTFGKELSEYAVAQGLGGIIHTDEDLENYDLKEEFEGIRDRLDVNKKDVVFVAAGGENLDKAMDAVIRRARKATEGVPEETRVSNEDGTTSYLRPLPGEARMYPETDVPPVVVSDEMVDRIEIPETLEEKKQRFTEEYGLSEHLAEEVIESRFPSFFERLSDRLGLDPSTIADTLTLQLKDLRKREGLDTDRIKQKDMESLLVALDEGEISKDAVPEVLKKFLEGKGEIKSLVEETKTIGEDELSSIINKVLDEKEELLDDDRAFKKLMGPVMEEVRGKIDGDEVAKQLKKEIKKRR